MAACLHLQIAVLSQYVAVWKNRSQTESSAFFLGAEGKISFSEPEFVHQRFMNGSMGEIQRELMLVGETSGYVK